MMLYSKCMSNQHIFGVESVAYLYSIHFCQCFFGFLLLRRSVCGQMFT